VICPQCSLRPRCLATRHKPGPNSTYRRYACSCGYRFSTIEVMMNMKGKSARVFASTFQGLLHASKG